MAISDVKILIVDDEVFFRKVLQDILGKLGFNVVAEASNGSEAVEMYRLHRPHVVIMDIFMPEKTGIEATKEIVSFDKNARVLVCSASDDNADTQTALDVGAKGIVLKPFELKEIFNAIKVAIFGS